MLKYLFRGRLRTILVCWFLGLSLLPLALLFGIFYSTVHDALQESTLRNLENLSNRQAKYIENWFEEKQKDITVIASSPVVLAGEKKALESYLRQVKALDNDFDAFNYVNREGKVAVSTNPVAVKNGGLDVTDRDYFQKAINNKLSSISDLVGKVSNRPMAVISCPVIKNGKVEGMIMGTILFERIREALTTSNYAAGGDIYLVNESGILLTEPHGLENLRSRGALPAGSKTAVMNYKVDTEGVNKATRLKPVGEIIKGRFNNYNNEPVYGVYQAINISWLGPDSKWIMVAERDEDSDLKPVMSIFKRAILGGVGVIIFLVVPVSLYFAKKITDPVAELAAMANGIARGDLEQKVSIKSYHELNVLGMSFNIMANQVRQSRKILERQLKNIIAQKEAIDEKNRRLLEVHEELQTNQKELEEKNTLLEKMAITDQLTQIYNRGYIMNRLPSEIAHATRYDENISVIMLDIDNFKEINDRYGHQTGDRVLKHVATVINRTIRKSDVPARFGGEEFIVICSNTNLKAAAILADRIRKNIARHGIRSKNELFYVTASLGVATLSGEGETLEQKIDNFFHTADMAMYRAKKYGRNRVEIMD